MNKEAKKISSLPMVAILAFVLALALGCSTQVQERPNTIRRPDGTEYLNQAPWYEDNSEPCGTKELQWAKHAQATTMSTEEMFRRSQGVFSSAQKIPDILFVELFYMDEKEKEGALFDSLTTLNEWVTATSDSRPYEDRIKARVIRGYVERLDADFVNQDAIVKALRLLRSHFRTSSFEYRVSSDSSLLGCAVVGRRGSREACVFLGDMNPPGYGGPRSGALVLEGILLPGKVYYGEDLLDVCQVLRMKFAGMLD